MIVRVKKFYYERLEECIKVWKKDLEELKEVGDQWHSQ